jgi:hypothetical protein
MLTYMCIILSLHISIILTAQTTPLYIQIQETSFHALVANVFLSP